MTVEPPLALGLRVVALGYLGAAAARARSALIFYRTFEHGLGAGLGRRSRRRPRSSAFWLTLEIDGDRGAAQHGLRDRHGARCSRAGASAARRCSTR